MDPWSVSEESFPYHGSRADQLRFLVAYAVLAPSYANTQPWLFKVTGNELRLYADRSRALKTSDPYHRNLLISCGTALHHLIVSARRFGFDPWFRSFPDLNEPHLAAAVRLDEGPGPTDTERALFAAIKSRLDPTPEPAQPGGHPHWLSSIDLPSGVRFQTVDRPADRETLAAILAEGDWLLLKDERLRRDHEAWSKPAAPSGRDELMPPVPPPSLLAAMMDASAPPALVSTDVAAYYRSLTRSAQALLVLSTPGDNSPSWLRTGMALDRILLGARSRGLEATHLFQPLDVNDLRGRLAPFLEPPCHPQAIVRIAETSAPLVTPRRPTQEFITRFV